LKSGPVTQVAVATLTVEARADIAGSSNAIGITATSSATSLVQGQSTDVFFVFTNTTNRVQTIDKPALTYADFLDIAYVPTNTGKKQSGADGRLTITLDDLSIDPGETRVIHLVVDASRALQPGKATIAILINATGVGQATSTSTFATTGLDLSVLGESAAATALGVPSLIFVPGIIFVVILVLLWTKVAPRSPFSIEPGTSGLDGKIVMWVLAALPTLGFPYVYLFLTGLWGEPRDYRRIYGWEDILLVWLMATVLAVVAWVLLFLLLKIIRALWVPMDGDSAKAVVRKVLRWPFGRNYRPLMKRGEDEKWLILRRLGKDELVTSPVKVTVRGIMGASPFKSEARPSELRRALRKYHANTAFAFTSDNLQVAEGPRWLPAADLKDLGNNNHPILTVEWISADEQTTG